MKIRDRIKEFKRVKASELLPNPKNWRTHPEKQQNAMRSVLAEIGFADAVLAYETPNGLMLVDGHLRTETAADAMVPVLVLDINDLEADKLLATLDPLAGLAGMDSEKLSDLFKGLVESEDKLIGNVWPDYMIDPLLSADWKPPEDDGSPPQDRGDSGESKDGTTVKFTEKQWAEIQLAFDASGFDKLPDFIVAACEGYSGE